MIRTKGRVLPQLALQVQNEILKSDANEREGRAVK